MKIIAAFLIVIAPGYAAAHQANNDSKPCPLSHWSTIGAACDYAPDLPPFMDSELKMGIARSKEGTYYGQPLPAYSKPLLPEQKINWDSLIQDVRHDPRIQNFFKDSLDWRKYKPFLNSPDPV
jgi:hypothetical protein